MIKRAIFFMIIFACLGVNAWALTVSEVIDRVEARYAAPDCQADFFLEWLIKATGATGIDRGRVYFKKPNMMRWNYESPEGQVIATDGETLWMYRPDEAQVMVGQAAHYFGGGEGLSFLADIPILRSQFQIRFGTSTGEKTSTDCYVLELTPHVPRSNLTYLSLWVSKDTFHIVRTKVFDPFENTTTITFDNIRFNQGLKSSFFVFEIPEGTEVIKMDGEEAGP